MNNTKQYNKTIAGLYKTKQGDNLISLKILAKDVETLKDVEEGGKFFIKKNKFPKGETSPQYYLEYMSADEVARFESDRPGRNNDDDSL